MNKWIKKSIELANSKGYLDHLYKIYPVEIGNTRVISDSIKYKISKAFEEKNEIELLKNLLKLPKFPIDNPYIASLRKYPVLLTKNPETVSRICKIIFSLGIEKVLELSAKPKSPSRQLGQRFKRWLKTLDYPFLEKEEFKKHQGIAFLNGGDKKLKKFVIEELKIHLEKGIDFLLKIENKFILGEAKFLTDYGGSQNNQFRDALNVAKIKKGNIIGIAVLDGIVWFKSNSYMFQTVKALKGIALSALLLEEFINGNKVSA
ncbi:hypothetical protein J7K25_05820 [bacterium]|nr:hypothetical protein [bacterium]